MTHSTFPNPNKTRHATWSFRPGRRSKRALLPFGLAAVAVGVLVACGGGGSGGSSPAAVVTPITSAQAEIPAKAKYQVVMLSASDGSLITDELSIPFTGNTPLVDSEGRSLNGRTITTKDGLVAMGAEFSATQKEFSVLAGNRVLGWVETGAQIVGDASVEGTQTVELKLLNIKNAAVLTADPTKAIATAVQEVASFTAATVVAAPPKTVTNAEGLQETAGGASLTIPAGTKAVDPVTGVAITTVGALTVSTTKYSNAEASAMSAFPGGFATSVTVPANASFTANPVAAAGGSDTGTFITGGFAQFNATDSTGKALKQFDKPLAVSIDLPKSSLDAEGNPVVVGGKYPVWSFDDASGEWKFEKEGIIREKSPIDPSSFTVAFETNHLSSWNLDFYVRSCTGRVVLSRGSDTRPLRVEVVGALGQRFARTLHNVRDSVQTLLRAPSNSRAIVNVYDGNTLVGRAAIPASLCNAGITVPLNLPPAEIGAVNIDVTESCPNGSNRRALPTFVYLSKAGVFQSQSTTNTGAIARATFSIQTGAASAYVFNKYTGRYVILSVTVPLNATVTSSFNFPNMPCATVTGAG